MAEKTVNANVKRVANLGLVDAMINGTLVKGVQLKLIFVDDKTEAQSIMNKYDPPALFVTYDLASTWSLKPDGTLADA